MSSYGMTADEMLSEIDMQLRNAKVLRNKKAFISVEILQKCRPYLVEEALKEFSEDSPEE